ncbi:MAG: nucleotidyltransferase domain-containing protein [Deltaproteobacteria bacterium]|nr:nucleotidyltransferase domain-containing protein [Deltaproteobacteria bacterium]
MVNQPITTRQQTVKKVSPVQRRSSGSVKIAFLDRNQAIAELKERSQELLCRDSRVLAVALFGSLAKGKALPSSDADLLIVLRSHPETRWFDRIPEYDDFFQKTSLPVEVFPYTLKEITRLHLHSTFIRKALQEKILLAGDFLI